MYPGRMGRKVILGWVFFLTSCPGGMDMSLPFAKRKGDFLQGEIFGWGERLGVVLSHREGSSEGLFIRREKRRCTLS
jgi:hypothetical protein